MQELIDYDSEKLLRIYKKEKVFPLIVANLLQCLTNDNTFKVLEIAMDFLEFLLTSLPESVFNVIE